MERRQNNRLAANSGAKVRRYFPGKAPVAVVDSFSSSESEDEEADAGIESGVQQIEIAKLMSGPAAITVAMETHSGTGSESEDGERELLRARLLARQLAAEEQSSGSGSDSDGGSAHRRRAAERQRQQKKTGQKTGEPGPSTTGSSELESSSGSETESDDGYGPGPMVKPMFVPKAQRQTVDSAGKAGVREVLSQGQEMEGRDRRDASVRMAASEARRAHEEPQIDVQDPATVDDTDDVDVDAEIDAWRQREAARVERDSEEKKAVEREEAEWARVRGMAEEDRIAEGMDRARSQREEKARQRAALHVPVATQGEAADADARLTQMMLDYAKQRSQPRRGNSKARGLRAEDTSLQADKWGRSSQ
ncbi:hypothetical protein H4R24_004718 [Coemansia sp. RSA 988]|nr:hypothetical protein H4R24_004718 [Coemansia sp. RSA 988]